MFQKLEKIKQSWEKIAKQNNIKIRINGLEAIPKFVFEENNLLYKSFISSELLKRNILAGNAIYVCTEHKNNIIENYLDLFNEVFYKISKMSKDEVFKKIDHNICIGGIRDNKNELEFLNNKNLIITGGTGSLGNALIEHLIKKKVNLKRLIVFSRDEFKQFEMQKNFLKKSTNL